MFCRIRFKPLLSLNRTIDFFRWNGTLLHDPVSHHGRHRPVEEIKDPAVDALETRAKFIDTIPQQVGLRPPQFVSQFPQSFHTQKALCLGLYRLLIEPFKEWA